MKLRNWGNCRENISPMNEMLPGGNTLEKELLIKEDKVNRFIKQIKRDKTQRFIKRILLEQS